jgi:TolB-like protein/DNA-binding winged helix-turn-helix (wHTH) protein/tetratricopeptide (TPR) repeat protein
MRFGVFDLDLQTGELRKSGVLLHLPPQPFKVLALLVSRPAELVRREEIRDEIWGTETFVDFEHGLNFAIKKIWDTLGDDSETPRFIETLPRRGYRFIAPVETTWANGARQEVGTGLALPGGTPQVAPLQKRWIVALTVSVLLGLVVALVALNVAGLRNRLLEATPLRSAMTHPRIDSIAVLPLGNLSQDPEQEYFADGMTEELITNLGKISALRVISRTSVMRYKGTKRSLPEIARELNVDAIVEGTVQRSGNRVRITVNLLHAPTDRHLWAESYERDLHDVLVLQGEVARSVAGEIRTKLLPQERIRLASTRSVDPEAYQNYLKGNFYARSWTAEGFKKGGANFRQAIDLDPTYAPAYEGLAEVYSWEAAWGVQSSADAYPLAKAAALKALELDETLADAHAELGQIKFAFDWDWSGAEHEPKRATILNPNSSNAHLYYGWFLTAMGRSDEAITETRKALELDPLTPTMNLQLGWVLYYARRHDESIAQLKKTLDLAPDFGYANMELGWNYAQKRMYPEAVAECQKAVSLMPEEQVTLRGCGNVYSLAGRRKGALMLLDRLKKLAARGYVDPYNLAWLYDGLGDSGHTMDWLERAYRERSAGLYAPKVELWSDRLRTDPRYQDLLHRMSFPP